MPDYYIFDNYEQDCSISTVGPPVYRRFLFYGGIVFCQLGLAHSRYQITPAIERCGIGRGAAGPALRTAGIAAVLGMAGHSFRKP